MLVAGHCPPLRACRTRAGLASLVHARLLSASWQAPSHVCQQSFSHDCALCQPNRHQWHWHNLAPASPRSPASPRIAPSQSVSPRQLLRFVPPFRSLHVILDCRNPLARIALRSRSLAADLPPPLMVRAPFARSPCFNTVASNIGMRQQYWCAPTAWLASSAPDKLMWPHSRI